MTIQDPLGPSKLKHRAIPFDQIKTEQFLPKLKATIEVAKKEIAAVINSPEEANFNNTIIGLENAGQEVGLVSSIFYNLLHSHTNEEMQKLAQEFGPLLSDYSSDITLNSELFKKIEYVYKTVDRKKLDTEDLQLLEETNKNFVRNGARLNAGDKERLRKIDAELSKLSPEFSDNVLGATNAFELHIDKEADLDGLPDQAKEAFKQNADEKNKKGWLVDLHAPNYIPFMQYAKNRMLRQKLWFAYASRAFNDKFDNQKVIKRILELRQERAHLLGYKNHAEFILEKRMAESPKKVFSFLKELELACLPRAKEEVREIEEFAKGLDKIDQLMPWDFSYYSEKLKQKKYHFDSEELRPYFNLDKVEAGVFEHARRLYGLKFVETKEYPIYHPDVRTYEVIEEKTGRFIGLFYSDYFPRPSKSGGAWSNSFIEQGTFMGQEQRPHVCIVCNFTKPTATTPSLLTLDEVLTLFHEFGHALHALLSDCRYTSLAGTNVYWDFVELPSQIMENWIKEEAGLSVFAHHYKTGKALPKELAVKIKESEKFLSGYFCLRQVQFATLDMLAHSMNAQEIGSVPDFEAKVLKDLQIMPKVDGTNFSCAFSHIFAGGYSAGYYSYKWAEVLDADAFEYFLEEGIFDAKVAKKFKDEILSKGGTEHPMTLYKRFRGREPDPKALLRRDGLI